MEQSTPRTRGLIMRLGVLAVWAALVVVSIGSRDPFRVAVSSIGLAATVATVILWTVQRRRPPSERSPREPD